MSKGLLSSPTELWAFLNSLGVKAKKNLSQNFLIDSNIIQRIICTANLSKEDLVLEIGPGPGALTQAILATGATVLAIEIDDKFAKALPRLDPSGKHLHVFHENFMTFPLEDLLKKYLKPGQKVKVITNLPYHLTTPIITRLVRMQTLISSLVLMVQDELAQRMVANKGNKIFGSLTVFLQFYTHSTYVFKVSSNCFSPVPKVNSAIVKIALKNPPKIDCENSFFTFVRQSFQQRRKMLKSSLKSLYPVEVITQALNDVGLDIKSRPERLSADDFTHFYKKCEELKASNSDLETLKNI